MFCDNNFVDGKKKLSCGKRWVSESLSFVSLFISLFVVCVTIKKVKLNLLNKLIIQIIISEIIDGINILLLVFNDFQGKPLFENFFNRRMVCFSQIYLGVFTCLWTLTTSLFISLRMYDIMIKRNASLEHFLRKYATTLSVGFPMLISYIIWSVQVRSEANRPFDLTEEKFYDRNGIKQIHFKHIYCWVDKNLNFAIASIVFLLIILNVYFSILRGSKFINEISKEIRGSSSERPSLNKQLDKMNQIKYTLWIYPLVSCLIWGFFFAFQIFCDLSGEFIYDGVMVWIYIVLIGVRQPIYTFIFFFTQKKIKECCLDTLICKSNKDEEKKSSQSIYQIESGSNILPEENNLIA